MKAGEIEVVLKADTTQFNEAIEKTKNKVIELKEELEGLREMLWK